MYLSPYKIIHLSEDSFIGHSKEQLLLVYLVLTLCLKGYNCVYINSTYF